MAESIKVLQNIKNALPDSMKLLLINSIVLSHIHYPAILLTGMTQSLIITLEKQLSWAVKATFNGKKIRFILGFEKKVLIFGNK